MPKRPLPIQDRSFTTIFEQSPISTQVFSPNGDTLRVNKAWETLWGVAFKKVARYNILKDRQLVKAGIMPYIKRGFKGEIVDIPGIRYEPAKSVKHVKTVPYRWVKALIYPVKDERGRIAEIVLQHEDITQAKIAEEKLTESQNRFKAVWDSAADAMAISDKDGTVLAANPAYLALYGYGAAEVIGKKFNIIFPKAVRKWAMAEYRTYFKRRKESTVVETKVRRKDGTERTVKSKYSFLEYDGKEAMLSMVSDITEQAEAQTKLAASEKRFRVIVEKSTDAIAMTDITGKLLYISPSAMKILGYGHEEHISQSAFLRLHEDEADALKKIFVQSIKHPTETLTATHRYLHKDGHWVWIETTLRNFLADPDIAAMVLNFRDVSKRKKEESRQLFLNKMHGLLGVSLDENITLTQIAEIIVPELADYCRVVILDNDGSIQEISVNHKNPSKVSLTRKLYDAYTENPTATHGVGHILRSGKPEIMSVVDEKVYAGIDPAIVKVVKQIGLRSYMGVPLLSGSRTIGVITFSSVEPDRIYADDDLAFAQEIAHRIVLTLDNIKLYKRAQANEAHYRFLAESMPQIVWTADPHGSIDYVNRVYADYIGVPHEKALEKGWETIIHPDDLRNTVRSWTESFTKGENYQTEHRMRRNDGKYRWFLARAIPMRAESGEIIKWFGTSTDIEDFKRAEGLIENERRHLQSTLLEAPAAIAILKGPRLVYTLANTLYERLIGKTDLIGKPGRDAVPELVSEGVWDMLEGVYSTGQEFIGNEFPATLNRPGSESPEQCYFNFVAQAIHDADGMIDGVLIHAVEVTEQVKSRKLIEELAREVESERSRLEAVLAQMPSAVLITEAPSGRIIMGNARVEEIFKHPLVQSASVGSYSDWAQAWHLDGTPVADDEWPIARAIKGETVVAELIEYRRIDGVAIFIRISAAPIRDAAGNITHGVAIFDDVTREREYEQRKDDFISMASHELKTPVTSMKLFTQVLQKQFQEEGHASGVKYLKEMDAQIDRLTRLIRELLDVSKIYAGKMGMRNAPFRLDVLAREIVGNFEITAPEHRFVLRGSFDKKVRGDKDRIGQVLINLLSNAAKYSAPGTDIIIRITHTKTCATLSVQDRGIGIPEEHKERIFERFYQVTGHMEKTYPGLGMGLYISSEIVRQHGGRMWVESAQGKGSTFFMSLPLAATQKKQPGRISSRRKQTK